MFEFLSDKNNNLSYKHCKDIYDNWTLGKRFVNALPNYAMSSERTFKVGKAPPEVIEKFKETCLKYNIDCVIKKASKVARIYGLSALFVASDKESYKNITLSDIKNHNIRFNVLDPLSLTGLQFSQDPTSIYYQRATQMRINNKEVGDRRFCLCINDMPLHLDFEPSNFNFAGKSVFKNMGQLIELWNNLFISLDKIATKASSIVIIGGNSGGLLSGKKINVTERSLEIIDQMKQGGVAFLTNGSNIEFFNLNGVTEIANMIDNVRNAFTMALSDTPISILLDKNLSNGLNEGDADFKATIMSVNAFRNEVLKPLYVFADAFLQQLAWGDKFCLEMKLKYPSLYNGFSLQQIKEMWVSDFKFDWEDLYPPTPKEITDEKTAFLENLLRLRELGISSEDLIKEINESDFFKNEFKKGEDLLDGIQDDLFNDY